MLPIATMAWAGRMGGTSTRVPAGWAARSAGRPTLAGQGRVREPTSCVMLRGSDTWPCPTTGASTISSEGVRFLVDSHGPSGTGAREHLEVGDLPTPTARTDGAPPRNVISPEVPPWRGIAAVLVVVGALATLNAVVMPWQGTLDSTAHLDYMYQLHHGHLPEPNGYAYLFPWQSRLSADRQWASAHPPLWYALAGVFTGPLLDAGRWEAAVATARAINVALALAGVAALARATWVLAPASARRPLVIIVPLVGGLVTSYLRFAGDLYNDMLVVVASITAMAVTITMIVRGVTVGRILALTAVAVVGMGSKATFLGTLAVALAGVLLAVWLHGGGSRLRRVLNGVAACVPVVLAPALAWGWFYLLNLDRSGSLVRSSPVGPVGDRPYSSALDVLGKLDFWLVVPGQLLGRTPWLVGGSVISNRSLSLVIFFGCAAAAIWRVARARRRISVVTWAGAFVLVLHLAAMYAIQFDHAVGYGQRNIRYLLPALLTIALIIAVGLTAYRPLAAALTVVTVTVMALAAVFDTASYIKGRYPNLARSGWAWDWLVASTRSNGFAGWLPGALMLIAAVGLVVAFVNVVRALRRPTSRVPEQDCQQLSGPPVDVEPAKPMSETPKLDAVGGLPTPSH